MKSFAEFKLYMLKGVHGLKRILSKYCGVFVTIYFYALIWFLAYLLYSKANSDMIQVGMFCLPILSGVLTFKCLLSYNLKEFLKKCFRYLWMSVLTFVILEIIIGVFRTLVLYSLGAVWATNAQLDLGEIFVLICAEFLHLGLSAIGMIASGCIALYRQIKIKNQAE